MAVPRIAIRVGVAACVAAACLLAAGRLDNAIAVFDYQADGNASATFNDRNYPVIDILPGAAPVMEDARLWMPEDATYRVVYGSPALESRFGNVSYFLFLLLWPRQQTELESADWVFCYRCDRSTLGPGYEVLSDSGRGLVFARRTT